MYLSLSSLIIQDENLEYEGFKYTFACFGFIFF